MPGTGAEGQSSAVAGQTPSEGTGNRPLGGYSKTAEAAFANAQAAATGVKETGPLNLNSIPGVTMSPVLRPEEKPPAQGAEKTAKPAETAIETLRTKVETLERQALEKNIAVIEAMRKDAAENGLYFITLGSGDNSPTPDPKKDTRVIILPETIGNGKLKDLILFSARHGRLSIPQVGDDSNDPIMQAVSSRLQEIQARGEEETTNRLSQKVGKSFPGGEGIKESAWKESELELTIYNEKADKSVRDSIGPNIPTIDIFREAVERSKAKAEGVQLEQRTKAAEARIRETGEVLNLFGIAAKPIGAPVIPPSQVSPSTNATT